VRIAFAFVLAVACGSKADPVPSCAQVVDHMLDITKQQMAGRGGSDQNLRGQMVAQCEQRNMPAEARRCIAAANDVAALAECAVPPAGAAPTRVDVRPGSPSNGSAR
jgi:hypothetical protein